MTELLNRAEATSVQWIVPMSIVRQQVEKPFEYWRDAIPEKYRKGEGDRCAYSVGQLKRILAELPDDLPIRSSFSQGATVIAFNVIEDHLDPHLQFEDGDYDPVVCSKCGSDIESDDDAEITIDGRVMCWDCPDD